MAHQSVDAARLAVEAMLLADYRKLVAPQGRPDDVWLIVPPFGRSFEDAASNEAWFQQLRKLASATGPNAVIALLTSPADAALTWPELSKTLKFQLWVAVKLSEPLPAATGCLPEHHAALLILTRYCSSLRHAKTRIAYSYCPACDKTTKDYGGKKHTYHEYGTLMSDVWRDLSWTQDRPPTDVVERLSDVFGVKPHRCLHVISLSEDQQLKAGTARESQVESTARPPTTGMQKLESRLLQGDSLEQLKSIPDCSVDLCFADPPYNLAKRYDSCDDALDIVEYFNWCDRWLEELARVLKPGRTCAVLNIPQWAIRHVSHLRTKLQYQNWIAWEGLSLPVRMIMPAHYSVVCFSKGPPRQLPGLASSQTQPAERRALGVLQELFCLRGRCTQLRRLRGIDDRGPLTDLWWDIHRLKHNSRRVDHPCQLPPALMRRLIALFTYPGEIILDPFNGAGTTSLCADELDRRYVGIELSERYHRLAQQRHEVLARGGNPFAKTDRVPKAKNSRVKRIGGIDYRVPKKVLQLEIREIARRLGRMPTREDVERLSTHPIRYFDEYFINWGEVCAAARTTGMTETRENGTHRANRTEPALFDLL